MASLWKRCSILLLLLLQLQTSSSSSSSSSSRLLRPAASRAAAVSPNRKLLQTPGAAVPVPPLKVLSNGKPCILFQARKLSLRYEKQKVLDLMDKSPASPVDTSQSVCSRDQATLVMRFGDVEDLKDLSIRLHLSNTYSESSGVWWFSVDRVLVVYNGSEDVVFSVSRVSAPSSWSYECPHVSSLQRYHALLLPRSQDARRWALTFTRLQIQAFNVSSSGSFSAASVCSTTLTPAVLMGLVTSLILLLVLAYALHMVVHLKHIELQHKADACCPASPELPPHCCDDVDDEDNVDKNVL